MREERRRYFRVDDTLGIDYRVLTAQEAKTFVSESAHQDGNVDFIANFDNRIQTLLDACKVQTPVAAELINLMNKKLNLVIQQLDVNTEHMKDITFELQPVNISACGMAFASAQPVKAGEIIQLDILLKPTNLHVVTMATVIACEDMSHETCSAQQPYYLRVDFSHIHHSDQELLIQHVVKRQSAQIKQRRRQVMFEQNEGDGNPVV